MIYFLLLEVVSDWANLKERYLLLKMIFLQIRVKQKNVGGVKNDIGHLGDIK